MLDFKEFACGSIDTAIVLPCKEVHPHNAEDEPEDQAYQENVHDGGDGPQKSIYNHLVSGERIYSGFNKSKSTSKPFTNSEYVLLKRCFWFIFLIRLEMRIQVKFILVQKRQ